MGSWTYADSGVDIESADALVERFKGLARSTGRPEVLSEIGGFGAGFALELSRFRQPVLVSGTDGVGTKLLVAREAGVHDTVGIDLVAMCANDVAVCGAEPLFFLDYIATGSLEPDTLEALVRGIAEGCRQAGCALVGGETAELPGLMPGSDYHVAGFCVGVVERDAVLGPERVRDGDVLVGLPSSGLHSNGYSLVRRMIADLGYGHADQPAPLTAPLRDVLLEPTRIYVRELAALIAGAELHAAAHITGGGIAGNLVRVLPDDLCATVDLDSFPRPAVFSWLLSEGLSVGEALRTFNMGLGVVAAVRGSDAEAAIEALAGAGVDARAVGRVEPGPRAVHVEGNGL